MAQKNELIALSLSLIATAGLIAGGFWWFTRKSNIDLNKIVNQQTENSSSIDQSQPQKQSTPSTSKDFASVQNVPTGLFSYGGSTSWAPIRAKVDVAIAAARPEFKLRYLQPIGENPSSGNGIKALIAGQLTFSQSSRPITSQEFSSAQQHGFKIAQFPVAIDGIAIAVNPKLKIPGLTKEQLKSIYLGNLHNWSQVGGANIPIKIYSRRTDGGTVDLFVEQILGGRTFPKQIEYVADTTSGLRKLAENVGGIYFASAAEVVPQCSIRPLPLGLNQGQYIAPYQEPLVLPSECQGGKRNKLNIEAFQSAKYPITRNFFVVVKQDHQTDEQAGLAYVNLLLSEQGQELISQSGFVKIR
jgi:phosphate transport system substrate-binding protein